MKRLIAFALLLFSFSALIAQDSVKVRFYVKGSSDFWIKLDDELLPLKNIQMITPGLHDIEIWSPMHLSYKGTLEVPVKDSISYYQELKKDPAYVDYLFRMDGYKRQVFIGRTTPLFLAVVGGVSAPILNVLRKRRNEDRIKENFKAEYFSSSSSGLDDVNRRYRTVNGAFYTSLVLAGGGIIGYVLARQWVAKLEKPTYKQQNPFTVEMFELGFSPAIQRPTMGLTIQF